jgi:4a-hydroxytetrahydrobiopterin dehydratase
MPSAWRDVDGHHLEKTFHFPDWKTALAFVNHVGEVAEELQHHPDVELSWGRVVVKLRTHDEDRIGPLDTLLAERIDALHL